MGMKTEQPNSADKALRDDILKLIRAHLTLNTTERVLAIASQVVGQALALQNPVTLGKTAAIDRSLEMPSVRLLGILVLSWMLLVSVK